MKSQAHPPMKIDSELNRQTSIYKRITILPAGGEVSLSGLEREREKGFFNCIKATYKKAANLIKDTCKKAANLIKDTHKKAANLIKDTCKKAAKWVLQRTISFGPS
ncbi:hypothetical protein AMTR_s00072p00064500 [Amborella trichopoda]|uniref:Uncharacterized protein n=1 Tax=Amborella trichopoda TaxID=13333 RepID=W1NUQ5_AMBTC|nr:hypothetical protein AMTR_s00072p00064500 [Amborella trichopoda]